jgi:hypothetical protein
LSSDGRTRCKMGGQRGQQVPGSRSRVHQGDGWSSPARPDWRPVHGCRDAVAGDAPGSAQRERIHSVTRWKASSRRPGREPMTTQPSMSSFTSHPQHLAVEPGQGARILAVDRCLLKASDHTQHVSMPSASHRCIWRTGWRQMSIFHKVRRAWS